MKRLAGLRPRALQLVFALSWMVASSSLAEKLVIEWVAPAECPERDELASRVGRLIGGAVHSDMNANTRVERTEHGYRAHVVTGSAAGAGERLLENARCDLLMESVALVLALSTLAREGARAVHAPTDDFGSFALALSAGGTAIVGPLPRAAWGVGGGLNIEFRSRFSAELRGSYYFPQSNKFADETIGARFRLFAFGARACLRWTLGALETGPCIGADVDHVAARGFGGIESRRGATTWWGPAATAFVRWRVVDSVALRLAVEGVVPLTNRRFVFSDVAPLYRAWPVALQLHFAPEVRF